MRLSLTLIPDETAPAGARTSSRALALGLSPEELHALQLVLSELVTNAVVHGPREGINVDLDMQDDVIRGVVVDQGVDGEAEIARHEGLGLMLVDELTCRWGVFSGSTHVWFEMDRAPRP